MKKILIVISLISVLLTISSCSSITTPNLVISKLFDATSSKDNVIEIYNASENEVDLEDVEIRIYNNGSTTKGGDHSIELTGLLGSKEYYVVSGNNTQNQDIKEKTDFEFEGNLPFNGNDVIELYFKNVLFEQLGYFGFDIDYCLDVTLIRLGHKEEFVSSKEFYQFDFITYIPDLFQQLKNDEHEIKTLEELYAGPKLENRFKTLDYVDPENENLGLGGAALTEVTSVADGDTASFKRMNGYPGGSLRYFYLNTPEVKGNYVDAEAWGYVASKYNKEYLLNNPQNKDIYVQSIPGNALKEGYGRNLALVWINGHLSQFLIVSEGLTEDVGSQYNTYDRILTYLNVPYLTFMRFAQERAIINGWGTKGFPANENGEMSPDWNYDLNKNTTENPVWSPNLDLPWA